MLFTVPRDIRDNVARACGFLQRGEAERALLPMRDALRRLAAVRLSGPAYAALASRVNAFLDGLGRHPRLRTLLDCGRKGAAGALVLRPGKEYALGTVLEGLERILRDDAAGPALREAEARQQRKLRLLARGLELLQQGQAARGGAYLRRAVEEFGGDLSLRLRLGPLFAASGLWEDAAETWEGAMRLAPREAAAYTGAVEAWMALRCYDRAERVYRAALRVFGAHPATLGKMAAMYLAWGRGSEAGEAARAALRQDAAQPDALRVLAALNGDGQDPAAAE